MDEFICISEVAIKDGLLFSLGQFLKTDCHLMNMDMVLLMLAFSMISLFALKLTLGCIRGALLFSFGGVLAVVDKLIALWILFFEIALQLLKRQLLKRLGGFANRQADLFGTISIFIYQITSRKRCSFFADGVTIMVKKQGQKIGDSVIQMMVSKDNIKIRLLICCQSQQGGVVVSRWAHNSKVGGSKPLSAIFLYISQYLLFIFYIHFQRWVIFAEFKLRMLQSLLLNWIIRLINLSQCLSDSRILISSMLSRASSLIFLIQEQLFGVVEARCAYLELVFIVFFFWVSRVLVEQLLDDLQFKNNSVKFEKYQGQMSSRSIQQVQTTEVAGFIAKTFEILKNDEFNKIAYWSQTGVEFIIKDVNKFQQIVLPRYFRHNKINSFIRQLNMYGFHKSRADHSKSVFSHPLFLKDREDLLISIKRKIKGKAEKQSIQIPVTPTKQRKEMDAHTTAGKEAAQTGNQLTSVQILFNGQINNTSFNIISSKQRLQSLMNLNFTVNNLPLADMGTLMFAEQSDQDDECVSIQHKITGDNTEAQQAVQLGVISYKFMNPSCFFQSMRKASDI